MNAGSPGGRRTFRRIHAVMEKPEEVTRGLRRQVARWGDGDGGGRWEEEPRIGHCPEERRPKQDRLPNPSPGVPLQGSARGPTDHWALRALVLPTPRAESLRPRASGPHGPASGPHSSGDFWSPGGPRGLKHSGRSPSGRAEPSSECVPPRAELSPSFQTGALSTPRQGDAHPSGQAPSRTVLCSPLTRVTTFPSGGPPR